MQPELAKASEETEQFMQKLTVEKEQADEKQRIVANEEKIAKQ